MIYETLTDAVGHTPVIKLSRLCERLPGRVFIKLENLNPGGSHKVRIALNMIRAAEQNGYLSPGSGQTIIEPSGGNTGMGLAIACAILGYKLVLVIPDNYSLAKRKMLSAMGAQIILSETASGSNSHGRKAAELYMENPGWILLNQQGNPANPAAHRQTTALEILSDFANVGLDYFVAGIGTGGHITGIGGAIKERWPTVQVIGVQPDGCDILNGIFVDHRIQGLAVGIKPKVLDESVINEMRTVGYDQALDMMRLLMRSEGLAVGISSAACMAVAVQIAAAAKNDANILAIAYDGAHDYLDCL